MSVEADLKSITDDRLRYKTALHLITSRDLDEIGVAGYALYANLVANLALQDASPDAEP